MYYYYILIIVIINITFIIISKFNTIDNVTLYWFENKFLIMNNKIREQNVETFLHNF